MIGTWEEDNPVKGAEREEVNYHCHNHGCLYAEVVEMHTVNNIWSVFSTPQLRMEVPVKVCVSGMRCHLDSSTVTTDVMMVGRSRDLSHLYSLTGTLDLMSGRYIRS